MPGNAQPKKYDALHVHRLVTFASRKGFEAGLSFLMEEWGSVRWDRDAAERALERVEWVLVRLKRGEMPDLEKLDQELPRLELKTSVEY